MQNLKRVSFDSPHSWELGCESILHCSLSPEPPIRGEKTLVRLTHTNSYNPIDDVTFSIRVGDIKNATEFEDMNSATDWAPMELVEEIVIVDDEEMHRADANEPFDAREEIVWSGTFEASLSFKAAKNRIEIRVSSAGPIQSGVISDWKVKASGTP